MTELSRRLPAIAALIVAAILSIVASALLVRLIEARSYTDVSDVLRISGFDWAQVTVDGLQVDLTGTAPSEAVRFRALSAAASVVDSARVIDHMGVADHKVAPPRFSVEILRNDGVVSLIGLIPLTTGREALAARFNGIRGVTEVNDLLSVADYAVPGGWDPAIGFALDTLARFPRAKLSVAADAISVSAMADSAEARRKLEAEISRAAPEGVALKLDITAPRPAITPFSLRFLIDDSGRAKFDSCSADTPQARDAILSAAVAAGLQGKASCVIGLGSPSPRWGEAAARAIKAVAQMGGGSVTFADADVSLVAPATVPKEQFDATVGGLQRDLPDAFSLHAVLTPPAQAASGGDAEGPPEFSAAILTGGGVTLKGRIGTERDRAAIGGFARAMFGAGKLTDTTRLDPQVPQGWAIRVLAALEAMKRVEQGKVLVRPDLVRIEGKTGLPDAKAEIAQLFSTKLGEGAHFEIEVEYDEKLDATLGLPTPEECVAQINEAITAKKITFAPGSAEIEPGAGATLDKIAGLMKTCADFKMEIGGHTDSQGREEMNRQLSQSRAEAVIEALVKRRALTGNLTARGYGEEEPIADNGTEDGREANRRIEFKLIKDAAEGETKDGAAAAPATEAGADAAADGAAADDATGNDAAVDEGIDEGAPMDDVGGSDEQN